MRIQLDILNHIYTKIITAGHHLAPKIFIRKLPATRRVCKLVARFDRASHALQLGSKTRHTLAPNLPFTL